MRLNLYSSVLFCCCFPVLSIFFCFSLFRSNTTTTISFLVFIFLLAFFSLSVPPLGRRFQGCTFIFERVCVLISVVCGIERGVAYPLFYLIVEYVRYLNLLNGRISLSFILRGFLGDFKHNCPFSKEDVSSVLVTFLHQFSLVISCNS